MVLLRGAPLALSLAVVLATSAWGQQAPKSGPAREALPLHKSLRKARAGGKYAMLLLQVRAPGGAEKWGDFRDLGPKTPEIPGVRLPEGHYVYVYPFLYVWRDLAAMPQPRRQWGPEQATGPPDTWPMVGDIPTAWAALAREGRQEWLLLEYPEPIAARSVLVYETFNPGALVRLTVFRLDGEEVEVWKGKEPTAPGSDKGISVFPLRLGFKTNRVKLYLDSAAVPGWNEIDAVGLRDGADQIHWASRAAASSTYAEQGR
jgi:hypothetical protein